MEEFTVAVLCCTFLRSLPERLQAVAPVTLLPNLDLLEPLSLGRRSRWYSRDTPYRASPCVSSLKPLKPYTWICLLQSLQTNDNASKCILRSAPFLPCSRPVFFSHFPTAAVNIQIFLLQWLRNLFLIRNWTNLFSERYLTLFSCWFNYHYD